MIVWQFMRLPYMSAIGIHLGSGNSADLVLSVYDCA